eukprot:TRINITY_DN14845_c0_g1_i1.p1 TRINITY_DN14845_c0_g1~~TRINITY_DN14845_c0_g1_i1.p1  ORF type:complete len:830 (+),score=176.92 TRINITY_DN14845_c0_g1_i1:68-2557(+)
MIDYGSKVGQHPWRFVIQIHGSVFPKCFVIVSPIALLALVLKAMKTSQVVDLQWLTFLSDNTAWGGFSSLLVLSLVFRLSQAYTKFWDAYSTTNSMIQDWFDAASSIVVFCSGAKDKDGKTTFLHTIVRVFSMLSACALQELSPRESHKVWGLLTLDSEALDAQSLATLDGSGSRVNLCYHWLQQLLMDAQRAGVVTAPAPIVGRAFAELGSGITKFADARKHALCQFNFPYAQAMEWLLILYSVLLPIMMVNWADWAGGAFLFTFIQLFFIWSLHSIIGILEAPFDTSNPNCIDVYKMQFAMNTGLLQLLDPRTSLGPPKLEKLGRMKHEKLQTRDTIHKAVLLKEGWQLKEKPAVALSGGLLVDDPTLQRFCRWRKPRPTEIAVSARYCTKRYGIVDDERTAVIPIGIAQGYMLVALPPTILRRERATIVEVESQTGNRCSVVVKKVLISDRHKLHKSCSDQWKPGEYADFAYDYIDLATAALQAKANLSMLPFSKVVMQADLLVEKKILDARQADILGHGIDQMVQLKTYEVFCKQLMEECGLSKEAADEEWQKRKSQPAEYDNGVDDKGNVIIALDVQEFKKKFADAQRELERAEQLYEETHNELERSKESGKLAALEAAIMKADMGAGTWFPDGELTAAREIWSAWQNTTNLLIAACEQEGIAALQAAVSAAELLRPTLQGEELARAEKLLKERQTKHARKSAAARDALDVAVERRNTGDLAAALLKAEEVGLAIEETTVARKTLEQLKLSDLDVESDTKEASGEEHKSPQLADKESEEEEMDKLLSSMEEGENSPPQSELGIVPGVPRALLRTAMPRIPGEIT